ncbi:hypothetical protein [Spirosoma sp.]|uniref:hypothetical protein n=1 Tax=Spirosoma sp. TaxID=1899569 RepID=UPI002626B6E2|nr:hypothetical protein [Spirosoma sp.]MCX6216516.1 hypothetical protein [Spirosoma sp.]
MTERIYFTSINLSPDEQERQVREFDAAWHKFVGPFKFEHDQALTSFAAETSGPIVFKISYPQLGFENFEEALEYMRTGKIKLKEVKPETPVVLRLHNEKTTKSDG